MTLQPRPRKAQRVRVALLGTAGVCATILVLNMRVGQAPPKTSTADTGKQAPAPAGQMLAVNRGGFVTSTQAKGQSACVSQHKADSPTADCQAFCNVKFKKFHCNWCKCRACNFCPKGDDAIIEASEKFR
eukprot:6213692-Pleurochrysis_carterae.AAC.2